VLTYDKRYDENSGFIAKPTHSPGGVPWLVHGSIALLVQAFFPGVAAMTDPSWWEPHKAWVHAFQWLVLLPACAVLAGYPRRLIWASALLLFGTTMALLAAALLAAPLRA